MKWTKLINAIPVLAIAACGYWYWQASQSIAVSDRTEVSDRTDYEVPSDLWQVVNVHDGDTIRVKRGTQEKKVRFACADAPELAQPMGQQSRDYLRSLIRSAKGQVKLKVTDTDRYGRSVSEVWLNRIGSDELAQSIMVGDGYAYSYDRYKENCPSWDAVTASEATAKSERLGVWGQSGLEKPWEYRKRNR